MDMSKYEYESDFARHFIAEGRREGRQQGRQEGRQEGRQALVQVVAKLLARRFGPLPAEVEQRLSAASDHDLERFADRLLLAADLAQVFSVEPLE